MTKVSVEKATALNRISTIVDKLVQGETLYREKLEKNELLEIFSTLLDKVSPEVINAVDDEELAKRVRFVMVTEATAQRRGC